MTQIFLQLVNIVVFKVELGVTRFCMRIKRMRMMIAALPQALPTLHSTHTSLDSSPTLFEDLVRINWLDTHKGIITKILTPQ